MLTIGTGLLQAFVQEFIMHVSSRINRGLLFVGLALLLAGCYQTAGSSVIPTVAELTATNVPQILLPKIASNTPIGQAIQASPTLLKTNLPPPPTIPAVTSTLITIPAVSQTNVPVQPGSVATDTPFVTAISTQGFLTPTSGRAVVTVAAVNSGTILPTNAVIQPTVPVLNTPTALPTEGACIHTVQPGDHVYSIARQYKVTVNDLLAANPSLQNNPDQLQVGQTLTIPNCGLPTSTTGAPPPTAAPSPDGTATAVGPTLYAVVKGDTLLAIAHKFNTTVAKLEQANGLNDQSILHIGQQLIIPPP